MEVFVACRGDPLNLPAWRAASPPRGEGVWGVGDAAGAVCSMRGRTHTYFRHKVRYYFNKDQIFSLFFEVWRGRRSWIAKWDNLDSIRRKSHTDRRMTHTKRWNGEMWGKRTASPRQSLTDNRQQTAQRRKETLAKARTDDGQGMTVDRQGAMDDGQSFSSDLFGLQFK